DEHCLCLAERCRRWPRVQVLGGDSAPLRSGAEVVQDARYDSVQSPDQDGFGRHGELVHLCLDRGALLDVWSLALAVGAAFGREATLAWPGGTPGRQAPQPHTH